jgi:hypothetical protein
MLRNPMAWGTYMLRKLVCVGFHSFPGKGAASWEATMKINPQITQIDTDYKKNKKISVICVICRHLFFIVFYFSSLAPFLFFFIPSILLKNFISERGKDTRKENDWFNLLFHIFFALLAYLNEGDLRTAFWIAI